MGFTIKHLRISIYTIIITLSLPLVLLITIPILLYRRLNQIWVKSFHNDAEYIGQLLKPIAQTIVHDYYQPNPGLNIVACCFGEGNLTLESLRKLVYNNVVESKVGVGKTALFEFPEFKSTIVKIGGYFYWRRIANFDIKDYVNTWKTQEFKDDNKNDNENRKIGRFSQTFLDKNQDAVTKEEELKTIVASLVGQGWNHGTSPWEVLLVNNYVDDKNNSADIQNQTKKSVVIFRIHHHVADGYSIHELFKRLSAGSFKVSATANSNSNFKRKLNDNGFKKNRPQLGMILTPILFPFQIALMLDEFTQNQSSPWRLSTEKRGQGGQHHYHNWSGKIPVESIKSIKNKFGVSFQAVINSVFAGALQNLMKTAGQEVPTEISTLLPIPLSHHPGGLTNHFGYLLVRLPVGENDPVRRLKLSAEELSRLSKSKLPFMTFMLYNYVGMFPSVITKLMTTIDIGYSLMFSPFPGVDGISYLCDLKITNIFFTLGSGSGAPGGTITTCSSYEKIQFGITMGQQVYPSKEKLNQFCQYIESDIQTLLQTKVESTQ